MAKVDLPRGFALWGESLQEKWLRDNSPEFTPCECGHGRAVHHNSRGMCRGNRCHCGRFVKLTRQVVHVRMMQEALLAAIDVIESLPSKGRSIKVGLPDSNEREMLLKQMRRAIAGPLVNSTGSGETPDRLARKVVS
jgi:hypothetical protein